MKHQVFCSDEDQTDPPISPFQWWKSSPEFFQNGVQFKKLDFSDHLTNLTPRLKVLREMERLALIAAEGLDDLRHKLIGYKSGDFWLPVGGVKKEELDLPSVTTVVLVGLTASGKSSLVNLMYSVLGRSGLIPFAQTSSGSSNYTTMFLEEHNVLRSMQSGFCVYDTRGLVYNEMSESLEEVSVLMADGVRHNRPCFRPGDKNLMTNSMGSSLLSAGTFTKRKVNCVVVVANLAEIYEGFKCGDLKSLEAIRNLFNCPSIRKPNESPILILTHGDKLTTEERINGRLKICEFLGIPETTGAYDIPCLTEQGILPEESDPVTAFALTEALYRALMQADRTHLPKRKAKDWILHFLSLIMCCIASFFAMLAYFFSKFGHKNKLKM